MSRFIFACIIKPEELAATVGIFVGTKLGTWEGSIIGDVEGMDDGKREGVVDGTMDGMTDGITEGIVEGLPEGSMVGVMVGSSVGAGLKVGLDVGIDVGLDVGLDVGEDEGDEDGADDGADVGLDVGEDEGDDEGEDVGAGVGLDVGADVGGFVTAVKLNAEPNQSFEPTGLLFRTTITSNKRLPEASKPTVIEVLGSRFGCVTPETPRASHRSRFLVFSLSSTVNSPVLSESSSELNRIMNPLKEGPERVRSSADPTVNMLVPSSSSVPPSETM